MTGNSRAVTIPKLRVQLGRYPPLLLSLGLAVNLLLPQITTLEHSLQVVQEMAIWGGTGRHSPGTEPPGQSVV